MKLTEEEIRPQKIFDEYLELARIDTINYFAEAKREEVNCFLCSSANQKMKCLYLDAPCGL